jgi:hypothetical protein
MSGAVGCDREAADSTGRKLEIFRSAKKND